MDVQITAALIGPSAFGSLAATTATVCSSKAEELFIRALVEMEKCKERTEIISFIIARGFFFFFF